MELDYRQVIESKYNRQNWQLLLRDIFKNRVEFWATPYEISTNSALSKQTLWLGTITLSDDETIAVYEVELSDNVDIERNRRGIRDMLLTEWRNRDAGAFMFCYRKTESVLRFSYVSESWNFAEDGSYQKESTDTKRFTYLLGEGHRSRTAIQQFEILKKSDLKLRDLTKAFSVEAVSKMFFDDYKKNYEDIIQYITGKRMVKVANKWEEKVMHDPCEEIMDEFAHFPNPEKAVRDYVKKLMGRLVFLQFLQKKGWLGVPVGKPWGEGNPEFIQQLFADCRDKDHFVDNVLEELFNDLNTERTNDLVSSAVGHNIRVPYLNGGLFEREATDETEFPLPARYMQQMLDFFASYNFTIDENDPDDAEVGVDPEMLGRIFENLLEDNKDKGAFYTPKEIVTYMCRESLIAYLQTDIEDEETKEAIRKFVTTHEKNDLLPADTDQKLKDVKICDPAIGSGAFPMGLLKELFQCRTALEGIDQSKAAEIKKHIIQNNIYGVDIERGAVDIARLRFWLSLIVDEENPQALPNLDYKIVEGNSLITTFDGQYINLSTNDSDFRRSSLFYIRPEKKALQAEQKRFFTLTGDDKYRSEIAIKNHILNIIWYQLDYEKHSWKKSTVEEAGLFGVTESKGRKKNKAQVVEFTQERQEVLDKCEALQVILNDESKSLQERASTIIPFFEWETVFSEVFDDETQKGFDIVIGNPPYIQLQINGGELATLYENSGFETYVRTGDIYCLFYERGWLILKQKGNLCFITSNKWMRSGYGEKTRKFFIERTNPRLLIDFAGTKVFDSATVETNILLFTREKNSHTTISAIIDKQVVGNFRNLSELIQKQFNICNYSSSERWLILSPIEQSIKKKIDIAGEPLKNWDIRVNFGIKTGFNDAFIIDDDTRNAIFANCQTEEEVSRTQTLIRPILRGRDIKKYYYDHCGLYILNTHNGVKGRYPRIEVEKYPAIKRHLDQYWNKIASRSDKGDTPYNLRNCAYLDDFSLPKIIWKRIGSILRFSFDDSGCLGLDSTCFATGNHIPYLCCVLNSTMGHYLLKDAPKTGTGDLLISVQAIEPIKVPYNASFESKLTQLLFQIISEKEDNSSADTSSLEHEIDRIVFRLYGLTYDEVRIIDPIPPFTLEEYEQDMKN